MRSSSPRGPGSSGNKFPFLQGDKAEEPRALSYLRDRARYLAPRGTLDVLRIPALLLRGVIGNFILIFPFLAAMGVAVGFGRWVYGAIGGHDFDVWQWSNYLHITPWLTAVILAWTTASYGVVTYFVQTLRGRQADFFVFTKRFVGSARAGYCPTPYLEHVLPGFGVGTAMAISGATTTPNMGSLTLRSIVFLMSLLNIRLGYWLPNPRRYRRWAMKSALALRVREANGRDLPFLLRILVRIHWAPSLGYFLREVMSRLHEESRRSSTSTAPTARISPTSRPPIRCLERPSSRPTARSAPTSPRGPSRPVRRWVGRPAARPGSAASPRLWRPRRKPRAPDHRFSAMAIRSIARDLPIPGQ